MGSPSKVKNSQFRLPPPVTGGGGSTLPDELDELELEELELLELDDELELLELDDELELLELEDELELEEEISRTKIPLSVPLSIAVVTSIVRLRSLTVVLIFGVV